MKPKSDKVYEIPAGIYSYTASAEGYSSSEVDRIDIVEDRQINIELISLSAWGIATEEEISNMLNLHYAGKINIEDYWAVGDERVIQLSNLGNSGSKNHVDQKMTMVIIGINHDDLKEQIGERTKAAITVQCRELLGNNGNDENERYWGYDYAPQDTDNYINKNNKVRTWLNGTFVSAMPTTFNTLIKIVNKKNLKYHSKTDEAPLISAEKAFLLSYPEVFGTSINKNYLNGSDVGTYEGTQYKYYQTTVNRIKYVNNDGSKSSNVNAWWLRSPSSAYSFGSYIWCCVASRGESGIDNYYESLAPAFCL